MRTINQTVEKIEKCKPLKLLCEPIQKLIPNSIVNMRERKKRKKIFMRCHYLIKV